MTNKIKNRGTIQNRPTDNFFSKAILDLKILKLLDQLDFGNKLLRYNFFFA